MKKHSLLIFLAAILTLANFLLLDKQNNAVKQLQAQVSQLNIELIQTNHQVRQLWEAQEKLLWVSQDLDQRLNRSEGRNMND